MKKIIAKLLKASPGSENEYFESSDWFEDESLEEIRKIVKAYEEHYQRRIEELSELLGDPAQTEKTHRKAISQWYPEAIRAACWFKDGKTICLALEQHDKETPVSVLLRCLTAEEIAELSE